MKYRVELSDEAKDDINDYIDAICYNYGMKANAKRIYVDLLAAIDNLSKAPESYRIRTEPRYWKFGMFVRRVNFKSRAIIYTIHDDLIYIHRLAFQSEITNMN